MILGKCDFRVFSDERNRKIENIIEFCNCKDIADMNLLLRTRNYTIRCRFRNKDVKPRDCVACGGFVTIQSHL
jgi:hypothetical protein